MNLNTNNLFDNKYEKFDKDSKYLTDEQKWVIVFLIKYFKLSYQKISEFLSIGSKGTVSKIWKKYSNEGTVRNLFDNCGRKRKIEQSDFDIIEDMIKNENLRSTISLPDIKKQLKKINNNEVSTSTISRVLNDNDYIFKKLTYVPQLFNHHKEHRLKYCNYYIEKNDQFSNVAFSDEVFFQINQNNQAIWGKKGENKDYWQKEKINNQKKIKIWGCISKRKKFKLIKFEGKMNYSKYLEVLEEVKLIEEGNKTYGSFCWRFMQDNAPPHIKKEVKAYLKKNLHLIDHPACSPDLNPIEHIWAWIKNNLSKKNFKTLEEIEFCVFDLWNQLTLEQIGKYVEHHVDKLPKIVELDGNYLD